MNDGNSLAPRFVIFHHAIEWLIENFGFWLYALLIILPILIFSLFALKRSVHLKEWDRFIMIIIFTLITLGGLLGLGLDIHYR